MDLVGNTNRDITICLTSCSRFDLLERTIKSLIEFWDYFRPKEVFIYEDSENLSNEDHSAIVEIITRYFGNWHVKYSLFTNKPSRKNGQIRAIDILYSSVTTPYIFHCEDDWEFTKTGFIKPSLDILENNPNISQVWIREPNDRNGHPAVGAIRMTPERTKYQLMKSDYRGQWSGFSFNPGLRRLSDYQKIGPYSDITTFDPKNPLKSEIEVGQAYLKAGFRAATLLKGYCRHIGKNRSVKP